MMLTVFKPIVLKLLGIIIFTVYSCFVYNVMLNCNEKSLMMFIVNIFIAGLACDRAITSFMLEENKEMKRSKREEKRVEEVKKVEGGKKV